MSIPLNNLRLIRKCEVTERMGLCKSTLYYRIKKGTFPPPIALGMRSVAWPVHEVDAMIKALMAGKPDDDLRLLVIELVASRQVMR